MPPRSAKMKRRIFGFQRRVWWPKWTPASSRSRIETAPAPSLVETAMEAPSGLVCRAEPAGVEAHLPQGEARAPRLWPPGSRDGTRERLAGPGRFQSGGEFGRQRRRDVNGGARDRMLEGEARRVEELPPETEAGGG